MATTKLVDRAKSGYSIRKHSSGTYQVYFGRVRENSKPTFTSRSLARARKERDWYADDRVKVTLRVETKEIGVREITLMSERLSKFYAEIWAKQGHKVERV